MYCVIQRINNKKSNLYGSYKDLEATSTTITINGATSTRYYYEYTGGRFERPIKYSYKISIHESYREKGKVKKRQWVICTMGYYDLIEYGLCDFIRDSKLRNWLKEMKISEDKFYNLIYKKLDPLVKGITKEFQNTEEHKVVQEHGEIIRKYYRNKEDFESKYGKDTYDYCYDVFGTLRNKEMLDNIKAQYKTQKEYESSYYENYRSNYNDYDFSSYLKSSNDNYTEEEKEYLKVIYKVSAMKLHPDIKKDNGEGMRFLNKLKDQWEI